MKSRARQHAGSRRVSRGPAPPRDEPHSRDHQRYARRQPSSERRCGDLCGGWSC